MLDIHYSNLYNGEINHWWYRVRREIIEDIFHKYIRKNNLKILDVGCGTGALMKNLRSYGEVYGLDFSEKALEFCRTRGEKNLYLGSVNRIPFENDFFDVVVSLDVLEHTENDVEAISEIKRVLKPGGFSVIFVPTFNFLWGRTDELSQHYRRYTLSDLKNKINNQGLIAVRSSYFNFFLFFPILIARLFVKIFGLKIENENDLSPGFVNNILYVIFHIESFLLRYVSFPFGVSCMVISKK